MECFTYVRDAQDARQHTQVLFCKSVLLLVLLYTVMHLILQCLESLRVLRRVFPVLLVHQQHNLFLQFDKGKTVPTVLYLIVQCLESFRVLRRIFWAWLVNQQLKLFFKVWQRENNKDWFVLNFAMFRKLVY